MSFFTVEILIIIEEIITGDYNTVKEVGWMQKKKWLNTFDFQIFQNSRQVLKRPRLILLILKGWRFPKLIWCSWSRQESSVMLKDKETLASSQFKVLLPTARGNETSCMLRCTPRSLPAVLSRCESSENSFWVDSSNPRTGWESNHMLSSVSHFSHSW